MINFLSPASRWGFNLLSLLGAILGLWLGRSIFIPTVMAVLLAALLWPAVKWLNHRLRLPWGLACMVTVGGLVLINLVVTFGFALGAAKMLQDLPNPSNNDGEASLEQVYGKVRAHVADVSPVPLNPDYWPERAQDSKLYSSLRETLTLAKVASLLYDLLNLAKTWMWEWILIVFILLFLLMEGKMLSRRVSELFGNSSEIRTRAAEALADVARQIRTYLIWRTVINAGLGLVVGIVYYSLNLKQAWTWALLTAVLCYVPYVGPILAGIPPVVDAFISLDSPWYAVAVAGFYLGIMMLEGYVIVPVVMGRSMEMNATTVMLACLFWELVWGTPGLFLAMPLMAAIKAVCSHVPELRPWANLMSSNPRDLPAEKPTVPDLNVSINESDLEAIQRKKLAERSGSGEAPR